jgi:hypothetical protein
MTNDHHGWIGIVDPSSTKQMQHILFYTHLILPYFVQHMWKRCDHDKMHENHKNMKLCRCAGFESTIQVSTWTTGRRITKTSCDWSAHDALSRPEVSAWKLWVDRKGQRMSHGLAHNTDQLVTGQLMIAWVDHRSAHGTVQLATGQLMECLSRPQVGAWHSSVGHGSAHGILESTIGVGAFPMGQRTPTYGRPLVRKLSFLSIFHCLKSCYFWLVS